MVTVEFISFIYATGLRTVKNADASERLSGERSDLANSGSGYFRV
jgi:hypothetical protein